MVTNSAGYREVYKQFRSLDPAEALRQALQPPSIHFRPVSLARLDSVQLDQLNLNSTEFQQAYEMTTKPGFLLIRNAFTDHGLYNWARLSLIDWLSWPNKSNLPDGSIVDPLVPKSKLRWITFGYHHDWDSKVYSDREVTQMPPEMVKLGKTIACSIGYDDYKPEASIVNYYNMRSSMSGHVDRSERNLHAPLISISLGQSCVFLLGGQTLQDEPIALALRHGDICVMTGPSRLAYHGVPRIVKDAHFRHDSVDPKIVRYLNEHRINFNIRQVD